MAPAASVCGCQGRSGLSGAMSRDDVAQPANPAAANIVRAKVGLSRRMNRDALRGVIGRGVFELDEACITEIQQRGVCLVV